MVKTVRFFIEGDKQERGKGGFISLRQGFTELFTKWAKDKSLEIEFDNKLLGSRGEAVNIFLKFVDLYPNQPIFLLIDTEREKDIKESAKLFLKKDFPNSDFKKVKESQLHFMAQAMESWFLADKEKLAECFDQKFNSKALPAHKEVEKIPKKEVIEKLKTATKDTSNGKGKYDKGTKAGKILKEIRPHLIIKNAPHGEKLFQDLEKAAE